MEKVSSVSFLSVDCSATMKVGGLCNRAKEREFYLFLRNMMVFVLAVVVSRQ